MTNPIDNSTLAQLGLSPRSAEAPRDKLGQEDFMKLMVTQLSNQDPFKPMESGEFLGQLAQFGTVSGISDMQESLKGLAGAMFGNQTLQAAGLVDREVLVPSREAWLPPEGVIRGAVEVPRGARDLSIEVTDLNGRLVHRLPVSEVGQGRSEFEWDGTLADGTRVEPGFYELSAAGQLEGETQSLGVLVAGRVENVSLSAGGSSLALTVTGLGVVDFNAVRGIQ